MFNSKYFPPKGSRLGKHMHNLCSFANATCMCTGSTPSKDNESHFILQKFWYPCNVGIPPTIFTPQLVGFGWQAKPTSWGVLRLFWITCVCVCVCVCVYVCINYVCAHHNAYKYTYWKYMNWRGTKVRSR